MDILAPLVVSLLTPSPASRCPYLNLMYTKEQLAAGKAAADLICETPVVREIAGAVVSVLDIFRF